MRAIRMFLLPLAILVGAVALAGAMIALSQTPSGRRPTHTDVCRDHLSPTVRGSG